MRDRIVILGAREIAVCDLSTTELADTLASVRRREGILACDLTYEAMSDRLEIELIRRELGL